MDGFVIMDMQINRREHKTSCGLRRKIILTLHIALSLMLFQLKLISAKNGFCAIKTNLSCYFSFVWQ